MRAVIQRVSEASVSIDGEPVGVIGSGAVILLGVGRDDTPQDVSYLAEKVANLRIFEDNDGKMNCSLLEVGGEALVISQFTLYGDCRRGRRPSFTEAAAPSLAEQLYLKFVQALRDYGLNVATGKFQADMLVHIDNTGPVTILIDSRKTF